MGISPIGVIFIDKQHRFLVSFTIRWWPLKHHYRRQTFATKRRRHNNNINWKSRQNLNDIIVIGRWEKRRRRRTKKRVGVKQEKVQSTTAEIWWSITFSTKIYTGKDKMKLICYLQKYATAHFCATIRQRTSTKVSSYYISSYTKKKEIEGKQNVLFIWSKQRHERLSAMQLP